MAGALKELSWSNVCRLNEFKDPGLLKALTKYAKAGNDVDKQLDALEEVVEMAEEAENLSSKSKNKVVSSYLDDVLSEARKEMKKLDDDDDSLPPLGENCDKFLDQAKKGKPRTFLLVCKGNRVKYLVVKKKPVKKSELAEAKKSGYKGEGYFGVITGQGMNLVFNLSEEDGYTGAPCKEKSLKNFLKEHADFECKPAFAIVATAPTIPFDEDDLSNPLIARFMAMETQMPNVLDVRPEAEAELTKTVREIRLLLQDGDFTGAEPRVSALATRLQELLGGGPATAPAESAAPIAKDPEMARFLVRLKALKPDIDAAIAAPNADPQIKVKFSEVGYFARKKEFAQANVLLFEVEKLLQQSAVANPTKKTGEQMARESYEKAQAEGTIDRGFGVDLASEALKMKLQEALNKLEPQVKQAVATNPGREVELLTPVAQIKKQMDAGELQEAKAGIVAFGQLLKSVMAQGTSTATTAQPSVDPRAEFEGKLAALQPNYDKALKEMLGDTGKFRAVMAYATEQAEASSYGNAIKAIDRLATAVNNAIAAGGKETDVIEKGTVAARVAQLEKFFQDRFAAAKNDTSNEVAKIENGIQDVPDENPAELVKKITDAFDGLYKEAEAALVGLLRSSDKSAILNEVANWRTRVSNDPLVAHVMTSKNKIGVDANVRNNFEQLFSEIEAEVQKTEFVVV